MIQPPSVRQRHGIESWRDYKQKRRRLFVVSRLHDRYKLRSDMNPDVRWRQRFQNLDQALKLLSDALKDGPERLSLLEKEGVIRRFEYTFELAWKTVA
jgi:Nucleotidyltransferase substrate binding protein like